MLLWQEMQRNEVYFFASIKIQFWNQHSTPVTTYDPFELLGSGCGKQNLKDLGGGWLIPAPNTKIGLNMN